MNFVLSFAALLVLAVSGNASAAVFKCMSQITYQAPNDFILSGLSNNAPIPQVQPDVSRPVDEDFCDDSRVIGGTSYPNVNLKCPTAYNSQQCVGNFNELQCVMLNGARQQINHPLSERIQLLSRSTIAPRDRFGMSQIELRTQLRVFITARPGVSAAQLQRDPHVVAMLTQNMTDYIRLDQQSRPMLLIQDGSNGTPRELYGLEASIDNLGNNLVPQNVRCEAANEDADEVISYESMNDEIEAASARAAAFPTINLNLGLSNFNANYPSNTNLGDRGQQQEIRTYGPPAPSPTSSGGRVW